MDRDQAHTASKTFFGSLLIGSLRFLAMATVIAAIQSLSRRPQIIVSCISLVLFLWRYVVHPPENEKEELQPDVGGLRFQTSLLMPTVCLSLVCAAMVPWWQTFFSQSCASAGWYDSVWPISVDVSSSPLVFAAAALAALPAPLLEEFTFRRWLLQPLVTRWGPVVAIALTSVGFALVHLTLDPRIFALHLAFGLLLGLIAVVSGSVWPGVLMHFVWNFTTDILTSSAFHDRFRSAFATNWFRCRASGLFVGLSIILIAVIAIVFERNRTALHPRTHLNSR